MQIEILVTNEELNEHGFDEDSIASHVVESLDSMIKELPGFNVGVTVIN